MKCIATFLFIFLSFALFAEEIKDTVMLDEVIKTEKASANIQAYESPFTDLKYQLGSRLSDALSEYSSVYIKNYGSGQLASIAVRGTSATQTEVQWNGIKLNSPSLGQVDLSLFTIGMQDELQLSRTGSQGVIGGTLKLDNKARIDSGFSAAINFRLGSFGTYEGLADVQYAKKGFSGVTRFSYLSSQNNFSYRNNFEQGNPYKTQTNSAVQQYSFLQQLSGKINEQNELSVYLWLIGAQRQIPPIMSKPEGKESQEDRSVRAMLSWKGTFNRLKLKATSGYMYDRIHYKNPDAFIDDISATHALRNKFSTTYLFPFALSWNTELSYDYEQANISQYGSVKSRNTIGLKSYLDYYLKNKFRFHLGFREDLVGKKLSAFAPELSFNYLGRFAKGHSISVGIMASRNFRFPTLNDLYWVPGGNPDLKQEKAWNGEVLLKYSYRKMLELSFSNFYIYADNWIQWVPQGSIWMPVNFKRVFSRGFEGTIHLTNADEEHLDKFTVHFSASYTYTRTTNLDANYEFDLSQGKQLIYVPLHNASASLQLQYKRFYLRSINTYTGSVFTSTDNAQSLKGYLLNDLELGKDFVFNAVQFGLAFRVNNIANVQYQNVVQRPMPGRNFEGIVRFKIL